MSGHSIILLIAAVNAVGFAALLCFSKGNRAANRIMAALILLLTLRIGPHVLGLMGVHDDDLTLVFLPLDFAYAFGPLLWIYTARLTHMELPPHWRWHFLPAGMQLIYWLTCSLLPLPVKAAWYEGPHSTLISPICGILGLVSATYYLAQSWRLTSRYRMWLDDNSANHEDARLLGLRAILLAYAIALAVLTALILSTLFIPPSNYGARAPIMLVLALLTYALSLLGWRYSGVTYPPYREVTVGSDVNGQKQAGRSYREQAEAWQLLVRQSEWWRDETLDLAGLANQLGASPRTVSRVLSQGFGENFRSFIGRIRVEAVCAELAEADDSKSILDIALASGFNSKASFNRVFLQHRRMSPSAYRSLEVTKRLKSSQSAMAADSGATNVNC